MKAENERKKEYAKLLYLTDKDLSIPQIAERVGVSERSVRNWASAGLWDTLRRSMLTSKSVQIARLYQILESVTQKIENSEDGIGDTKLADMMIKYTAAINELETDSNAAEMVQCMMKYSNYVQRHFPDQFAKTIEMSDAFVQENLA